MHGRDAPTFNTFIIIIGSMLLRLPLAIVKTRGLKWGGIVLIHRRFSGVLSIKNLVVILEAIWVHLHLRFEHPFIFGFWLSSLHVLMRVVVEIYDLFISSNFTTIIVVCIVIAGWNRSLFGGWPFRHHICRGLVLIGATDWRLTSTILSQLLCGRRATIFIVHFVLY